MRPCVVPQMALPKGTHHIPDHFQHLKITGVPYALVNNLNETSSTRSFLEDPDLRLEARDRYASDVRPAATVLQSIDAVLRSCNPLVMQLVNWSETTTSEARPSPPASHLFSRRALPARHALPTTRALPARHALPPTRQSASVGGFRRALCSSGQARRHPSAPSA